MLFVVLCTLLANIFADGAETNVTCFENHTATLPCSNGFQWLSRYKNPRRHGTAFKTLTIGSKMNKNLPIYNRLQILGEKDSGKYDLQIRNVAASDSGFYSCIAMREDRLINNTVFLKVLKEEKHPAINVFHTETHTTEKLPKDNTSEPSSHAYATVTQIDYGFSINTMIMFVIASSIVLIAVVTTVILVIQVRRRKQSISGQLQNNMSLLLEKQKFNCGMKSAKEMTLDGRNHCHTGSRITSHVKQNKVSKNRNNYKPMNAIICKCKNGNDPIITNWHGKDAVIPESRVSNVKLLPCHKDDVLTGLRTGCSSQHTSYIGQKLEHEYSGIEPEYAYAHNDFRKEGSGLVNKMSTASRKNGSQFPEFNIDVNESAIHQYQQVSDILPEYAYVCQDILKERQRHMFGTASPSNAYDIPDLSIGNENPYQPLTNNFQEYSPGHLEVWKNRQIDPFSQNPYQALNVNVPEYLHIYQAIMKGSKNQNQYQALAINFPEYPHTYQSIGKSSNDENLDNENPS